MKINGIDVVRSCRHCGALFNCELQICPYCNLDSSYPLLEKYSEMSFQQVKSLIDNAFFRLESFMRGRMSDYQYFGFNDAFTKLFIEARKPENFTFNNCKMIGKYWDLTEQIRVDFDKGDFENNEAYENEMFCKDCEGITYLNWERNDEFLLFLTQDEIEENQRKISITDLLKDSVFSLTSTETKTDKLKTELGKYGFFELPKVKQLSEPNKQSLVELISTNPMSYGIAMFDELGFCEHLDNEQGVKYKANKILSRLYNPDAKDGTSAKHYRSSLVKPSPRYKAGAYKETVKTDYQKLK